MALFSTRDALQLHGAVSSFSSLLRFSAFYKYVDYRLVLRTTIYSIPGYVLAVFLFGYVNEAYIYIIVGVTVLANIVYERVIRRTLRGVNVFAVSSLAGFATVFVGGTGVFVSSIFYRGEVKKSRAIASQAMFLVLHHLPKVFIYNVDGPLFQLNPLSIALLGAVILGTYIGRKVYLQVSMTTTVKYITLINVMFAFFAIITGVMSLFSLE